MNADEQNQEIRNLIKKEKMSVVLSLKTARAKKHKRARQNKRALEKRDKKAMGSVKLGAIMVLITWFFLFALLLVTPLLLRYQHLVLSAMEGKTPNTEIPKMGVWDFKMILSEYYFEFLVPFIQMLTKPLAVAILNVYYYFTQSNETMSTFP